MGWWQAATSRAVEEDRSLDTLCQQSQLLGSIAPPDGGAGHNHWALGFVEQLRGLNYLVGVRSGTTMDAVVGRVTRVEKGVGIGEVVEHVHWHLQEGGTGFATQHLAKCRGGVFGQA